MKPLSEMTHEEKCREFDKLNNIHRHEIISNPNYHFLPSVISSEPKYLCSCGESVHNILDSPANKHSNPTYSHAAELLEVMRNRGDWHKFILIIGCKLPEYEFVFIYYLDNSDKLIDACLEWSREHRLEGVCQNQN
jgi:hypothetical protein